MRIAIVAGPYIPVPPPQYGGTEQIVHYLIKGLLEEGHEPILLGPGDSKVNCEVVPIVDHALYFPRKKSDYATFKRRAKTALHKTTVELKKLLPSIDLIHSHEFDLLPFRNFPNLTTIHNMIGLEELPHFLQRKDLFFASISRNQQDTCPDLNYVGAVYNGEDPDQFPIVTEPEDYVCFLGRFDRAKNPHLAIQLAINLGIKIKVAGKIDFEGEGYFENEVEKYFSHPLVEYLGELGFDDKVELLSKAKCNMHPVGFREPFGLTVLEAAYCGTPTLAIARGSMPELIEEGRTGMLVEDYVEGYHQIEACFAMDRTYIATRARQLFNYKVMTRQYIEAYNKVLAQMAYRRTVATRPRLLPQNLQAELPFAGLTRRPKVRNSW
jgi:glycosyltransferase involved in cell wall biosynthesis